MSGEQKQPSRSGRDVTGESSAPLWPRPRRADQRAGERSRGTCGREGASSNPTSAGFTLASG